MLARLDVSEEELNRAANAAKHEGLGIDEADDGAEQSSEEKKDRRAEEQDSSMPCGRMCGSDLMRHSGRQD